MVRRYRRAHTHRSSTVRAFTQFTLCFVTSSQRLLISDCTRVHTLGPLEAIRQGIDLLKIRILPKPGIAKFFGSAANRMPMPLPSDTEEKRDHLRLPEVLQAEYPCPSPNVTLSGPISDKFRL